VKRLLAEPLLHFIAIGALIFALYAWVQDAGPRTSGTIVVSQGQVDAMAAVFERTWRRRPTQDEVKALVDGHVREEVFYREGLAMGLDRDDPLIRRRVRQKLEFLNESMNAVPEPDDTQLQAYLDKHPDRYAAQAQLTFRQVYLGEGQGGEAQIAPLLARLRKVGDSDAAAGYGKPTQLAARMESASVADIERTFGPGFARELQAVPPGKWQGPVASGYGLHLVLVSARAESRAARLPEVREIAARDWMREQVASQNEKYYDGLRARYTVRIESPRLASTQ